MRDMPSQMGMPASSLLIEEKSTTMTELAVDSIMAMAPRGKSFKPNRLSSTSDCEK
eukprot:CAMPEP_0170499008 /NCGR_PEP_ID=MMETSP0208-20121228/29750_1 /TAXON_ID=197538 /ORGANISM="Strombidium inclinatum, Strain S3" /LENGTH=55 /DNA_ID=CAMNT_0010776383 /DNA_START=537 /DNA_END=704 /DNA_ORIENTATION=-